MRYETAVFHAIVLQRRTRLLGLIGIDLLLWYYMDHTAIHTMGTSLTCWPLATLALYCVTRLRIGAVKARHGVLYFRLPPVLPSSGDTHQPRKTLVRVCVLGWHFSPILWILTSAMSPTSTLQQRLITAAMLLVVVLFLFLVLCTVLPGCVIVVPSPLTTACTLSRWLSSKSVPPSRRLEDPLHKCLYAHQDEAQDDAIQYAALQHAQCTPIPWFFSVVCVSGRS